MKTKLLLLFMCISLPSYARKKLPTTYIPKKGSYMSFNENIFDLARKNNFFRKEIVTGKYSQVVLMSIPVNDSIGEEVHPVDQTLIFVQGHGQAIIDNTTSEVFPNHLVFIPAGVKHNFKNIGTNELKLLTIYAPTTHKPGTVEKKKSEY